MINDPNPISNGIDIWKFVDDVFVDDVNIKDSNSNMQSNLDSIISWSLQNHMKLKPKNSKEMRISFQHDNPELSSLYIDRWADNRNCSVSQSSWTHYPEQFEMEWTH